jgi:hypothetical protein
MNYDIVTSRWGCPECQGALRLRFSQAPSSDENQDVEYLCEEVACLIGHGLPEELVHEAMAGADAEFYAALERGAKLGETWSAPPPEEGDPRDSQPTM